MKSCLKKFKLEFQKSINKDTTHVVMHTVPSASQVCDRSLKFLIGISKGLWVVNDGWLTDSVKANRIMLEVINLRIL
ncbi:breast cancer type 1 susceptibility protein homolog [Pecten maximus]|uniref:breast cancer type 1 susceptibility protein homolog n=1 Tax=Pecten maximus TaxID=6579 RepID=UPI001458D0F7|nr:breast cancer type 1 susceptibility protein homolog [Pecten maximus]